MSRTLQGLALACAVGLLAAGAWADDKDKKDVKPHALDDATFVKKAASDNMHEVKLGELGVKRGVATEVKEFAQKMVKDHSRSLDDLKKAAKSAKLDVPDKMSKEHQDHVAHLEKHDKDFDAAFVRHMVRDHEKAVALFEQASKDVKNDDLRKYAEKTLPVIREHLKMAKKLNEKYGGKDKADKSDKSDKGEKDKPVRDRPFKDR